MKYPRSTASPSSPAKDTSAVPVDPPRTVEPTSFARNSYETGLTLVFAFFLSFFLVFFIHLDLIH